MTAAPGEPSVPRGPSAAGRGNTLESVRQHNLSRVLSLVHRHGPSSRSELTRHTGLNRSTIAALVAELAAAGLVSESVPDTQGQVGRPSPVVRADASCVAFAVNPELDAITVGLVRMNGEVVARVRREVSRVPSVDDAVRVAAESIAAIRREHPEAPGWQIAGVGVAVPGLVRSRDGLVRLAPHLGWRDAPVAERMSEITGLAASAANDASLGAQAEQLFGAGRGHNDFIYLNGGASGIGGGVVANGAPLGGLNGFAGEFGHNLVTAPHGPSSPTTGGTLEEEVSRARLLGLLGLDGADPEEFASALRRSDDERVHAEIRRELDILSVALRNAINVLNPERVVLGGFLAALAECDPAYLERQVGAQTLAASWEGVSIVSAELGSDLLLIGAAEMPFSAVVADPAGFARRADTEQSARDRALIPAIMDQRAAHAPADGTAAVDEQKGTSDD